MGVFVSNIYVERQGDGTYVATRNHRAIATGDTQAQTVARARRRNQTILFWPSVCAILRAVSGISGAEFID